MRSRTNGWQPNKWLPINIHATREKFSDFFRDFVSWLDSNLDKRSYALFLPIKGDKLITDPYGFLSVENFKKSDVPGLTDPNCRFVYQIPTDPLTRTIVQVEDSWIQELVSEYDNRISVCKSFKNQERVIFKETAYKGLRGIFINYIDSGKYYALVQVHMFSADHIITVPAKYLESAPVLEDEKSSVFYFFSQGSVVTLDTEDLLTEDIPD